MSETPEILPERPNRTSLYLAILAILISLVGTGVSIFESQILREQQEIMLAEKAASVWPFVRLAFNSSQTDTTYTIGATFINKGVGPAVIGDIELFFQGEPIAASEIFEKIKEAYPEMRLGTSTINLSNGRFVVSPDEEKEMYRLTYFVESTSPLGLVELLTSIRIEACYCSIYGDCWGLDNSEEAYSVEECAARLELR